jgi:hypothetical protein
MEQRFMANTGQEAHAPEPIVSVMVEERGGEEQCPSRTRIGAKCILLTVMIVVFFVLTLNVSGDRTRVEL